MKKLLTILMMGFLMLCISTFTELARGDILSTFDFDGEGWSSFNNTCIIEWDSIEKAIRVGDIDSAWAWVTAPAKFHGKWQENGTLSVDLKFIGTENPIYSVEFFLKNNTTQYKYSFEVLPSAVTWEREVFSVSMNDSEWVLVDGSESLAAVLNDVTDFYIRVDFNDSITPETDAAILDNISAPIITFDADEVLYGVGGYTADALFKIDVSTGLTIQIGEYGVQKACNLALSPDGKLYATTAQWDVLETIDTVTGIETIIGSLGTYISGIAFGANGILYGIDYSRQGLVSIDTTTAEVTFIATLETNNLNSLASDGNGVLYSMWGRELVKINTATGALTSISEIDIDADNFISLTFAPDGNLYGVADSGASWSLAKIDPITSSGYLMGKFRDVLGNPMQIQGIEVMRNSPVSVSVSGTIHYSGTQTGEIYIAAVNPDDLSIAAETTILLPGPYSFSVPSGSYYIVAQMDTDQSGDISIETFGSEPSGSYDRGCGDGGDDEDILVVESDPYQNIDIYLSDLKQSNILHDRFAADYFSGYGSDMDYHDGFLWVCDQTWSGTDTMDIRKINPVTGNLIDSFDLGINHVMSLEWIGDELWVCFKDYDQSSWVIQQYLFDGTVFTSGISYNLPSSMDWDIIWSINIAWDGSLLWIQEKGGSCVDVYKMNLSSGFIVDTIPADQFGAYMMLGLADISDICFTDGYLWGMDDDNPALCGLIQSVFRVSIIRLIHRLFF